MKTNKMNIYDAQEYYDELTLQAKQEAQKVAESDKELPKKQIKSEQALIKKAFPDMMPGESALDAIIRRAKERTAAIIDPTGINAEIEAEIALIKKVQAQAIETEKALKAWEAVAADQCIETYLKKKSAEKAQKLTDTPLERFYQILATRARIREAIDAEVEAMDQEGLWTPKK